MCRAIEKNLESVGMGIEKISEIDTLVFEDDEIRQNHFYEKMNRANRRHNTANKKHRLGKSYRFCKEQIDAYVEQDGKLKWLDDMDYEECLQIDWSKVKAVNAENREYGFWNHGIKKAYSRKWTEEKVGEVSDMDCIDFETGEMVFEKGTELSEIEYILYDDMKSYESECIWDDEFSANPSDFDWHWEGFSMEIDSYHGKNKCNNHIKDMLLFKLNDAKKEIEKFQIISVLEAQKADALKKYQERLAFLDEMIEFTKNN